MNELQELQAEQAEGIQDVQAQLDHFALEEEVVEEVGVPLKPTLSGAGK